MKLMTQLQQLIDKNPPDDWLIALGLVFTVLLVATLIKRVAAGRLRRSEQRVHSPRRAALLMVIEATKPWLIFFAGVYFGSQYLDLPKVSDAWIAKLFTIAAFLQMGLWAGAAMEFWIGRSRSRALESNIADATSLAALSFVGKMLLWTIMLLLVLDNLGVNITAMVTGLGVGGIAVALAVQNILSDLFASLSIIVDKPFVIGDFVVIDEYKGTIEHVGLKTTRLRSLDGEQIVFSNSDMLKSRLRNYKRMQQRRVLFTFGVLYRTPPEQLEKIPAIVKAIVEKQKRIRFERAHFVKLGESSLDYEVVFWMLDPDDTLHLDAQQAINLELLRTFAREKIGFAYPTRTVIVEGALTKAPEATAEANVDAKLNPA